METQELHNELSRVFKQNTHLKQPISQKQVYDTSSLLLKLKGVLESTSQEITDAKAIMDILPDLYMVEDILVSSILSPLDLQEPRINLKGNINLPEDFIKTILDDIEETMDLENNLSMILSKALFREGAYIYGLLPVALIQQMIEKNNKKIRIPKQKSSLQSGFILDGYEYPLDTGIKPSKKQELGTLSITNDPSVLVKQQINKDQTVIKFDEIIDDFLKPDEEEPKTKVRTKHVKDIALYPDVKYQPNSNTDLLILKLPMESVMPVIIKGNEEDPIGYLILLDKQGIPLHNTYDTSYFKDLNKRMKKLIEKKTQGGIINIVQSQSIQSYTLTHDDDKTNENVLNDITSLYITNLETNLKKLLFEDKDDISLSIGTLQEVYQLLLYRQLANQTTQMLFLPKQLVEYIAFDYTELGIGRSLLSKTKVYASFRAILSVANIMASVNSSIPKRVLNITLDEADMDPRKTIESAVTEFMNYNSGATPTGLININDIVDALTRSGIQVKITGNESFPVTDVEIDESSKDVIKPNVDISDELRKLHYMGLHVTPEAVDLTLEGNFATGIVKNDLLQTKRMLRLQKIFRRHLTSLIKKYIRLKPKLYKELKKIYSKMKKSVTKNITLDELIDSLEVVFPVSLFAILQEQSEAYGQVNDILDNLMENFINSEGLGEMLEGDISSQDLSNIKTYLKNLILRKYIDSSNMLRDFTELMENEDNQLIAISKEDINRIMGIAKGFVKIKNKINKQEPEGENTEGTTEGGTEEVGQVEGEGTTEEGTGEGTTEEGGTKNNEDLDNFNF